MSLELPTEEWKKQRGDFHLDPDKQDKVQTDPLAEAKDRAIIDQITGATFETLDEVLENLSRAVLEQPELKNDDRYNERLRAAKKRLDELMPSSH